jgi:acetylornithine deacetylase/succinyl-diaminopimelate desuccinylase-like protein
MRSSACGRLLDDARRFRPRRQLEDAPLIDPGVPGEGWERVEREALALFRHLLRIDTTNPPGRETAAAEACARALAAEGIDSQLLARTPGRDNLVARLRGDGSRGPLLLNAHLDVVPADPQGWTCPPFGGEIRDGWVYGRGALDMKNMAALSVAVLRQLKRQGIRLARDLIFCGSADEEAGSEHGALWLVDRHPEAVRADFGLGEVGGFSLHVDGRVFHPVMVAQKGVCWFRMRARGEPGHGSIPRPDSAVVRLSRAVAKLGESRLPPHATPLYRSTMRALAAGARGVARAAMASMASETIAYRFLPRLGSGLGRSLAALLSNTASPTGLSAGSSPNVHPAAAECVVDGRTLPGQTREDLLREVRAVVGPDIELEPFYERSAIEMPVETPLFEEIATAVAEMDAAARVVPVLMPGFTDAYAFSRLGCTFHGFVPLRLPPGVPFADLFHGEDERIPVDGFLWGLRVLYRIVRGFCT